MNPLTALVFGVATLAGVVFAPAAADACTCQRTPIDAPQFLEYGLSAAVGELVEWDAATERGVLVAEASWFSDGAQRARVDVSIDVSSDCGTGVQPTVGANYVLTFSGDALPDGAWRASGCTLVEVLADDDAKAAAVATIDALP